MVNELCELFLNVVDGDTVVLEKDKTYHVRQDDSFVLDGMQSVASAVRMKKVVTIIPEH